MPRVRSGFSGNAGAINPRIVKSDIEPKNPRDKDIWVDNSYNPPIMKMYYASTSTWRSLTNFGITDLDFYDDGFFVTYDDGTQEEWSWTLDGSDRITNLTNDDTSREVDITWNTGNKP